MASKALRQRQASTKKVKLQSDVDRRPMMNVYNLADEAAKQVSVAVEKRKVAQAAAVHSLVTLAEMDPDLLEFIVNHGSVQHALQQELMYRVQALQAQEYYWNEALHQAVIMSALWGDRANVLAAYSGEDLDALFKEEYLSLSRAHAHAEAEAALFREEYLSRAHAQAALAAAALQ